MWDQMRPMSRCNRQMLISCCEEGIVANTRMNIWKCNLPGIDRRKRIGTEAKQVLYFLCGELVINS
jgi:hypothetical protein